MITTSGGPNILRNIVSGRGVAADMAFGIGSAPATLADSSLGFEIHRSTIDLFDSDATSLLLRARIPDQKYFELHEIGLFDVGAGVDVESPSHIVTLFDESSDTWTGYDFIETTGIRSGTGAFRVNAAGTVDSVEQVLNIDAMLPDDEFAIAYNRLSGSMTFEVRFLQDGSNYLRRPVTVAAGFNVARWKLSDMLTVGSPDFAQSGQVHIVFSGTGSVLLEGLRINNPPGESDLLIARKVLTTPEQKSGSVEMQVEYKLNVGFA